MDAHQSQPPVQSPRITMTSPTGHTTNTPIQPLPTPSAAPLNATSMTPPSTVPTQVQPVSNANLEPPTYNEQLNAADRLWKFKSAVTIVLILTGIIGIGCTAWAVSTMRNWRSGYDYGYDSTWSLPWGLITFSISVVWCALCIVLFLVRKRPVHPGVRVTMELFLWLGFLFTALLAMVALFDLLQWGDYGSLGYSSGWSSRYGGYVLQQNNTWVWEQDSDYSVTYERVCNSSDSQTSYSTFYYSENPFKNCAEMDAYVNALWQAKPNRARTELAGVVCQFLGLVSHFVLFVWACIDCHKHRHSVVNKDAEKIAAGIVERMIQNGAVVPPSRQAYVGTVGAQSNYQQVPVQPNGFVGQGYIVPGQQHPMSVQGMPVQQMGPRSTQMRAQQYQQPLPPLPSRHQQAGPSNEKTGGVAASYYEPGR